jgi:hypothetical protein
MAEGDAFCLTWFPPDQWPRALERWPDLADDFETQTYEEYVRILEVQLQVLRSASPGDRLGLAPIVVDTYLTWCEEEGADPEAGASRAAYAAETSRRGEAVPWPPERNSPCWCASGRKYKQCCDTVVVPPELSLVGATSEWATVRVDLVGQGTRALDKPPGRVFLVGPHHTFGDLAAAIDFGFARWDLDHLHEFTLADGTRIGAVDEDDDPDLEDEEVHFVLDAGEPGTRFEYVFDLGDEWRHRCEIETWEQSPEVDGNFDLFEQFTTPMPVYGWGTIPDQYGNLTFDPDE